MFCNVAQPAGHLCFVLPPRYAAVGPYPYWEIVSRRRRFDILTIVIIIGEDNSASTHMLHAIITINLLQTSSFLLPDSTLLSHAPPWPTKLQLILYTMYPRKHQHRHQ